MPEITELNTHVGIPVLMLLLLRLLLLRSGVGPGVVPVIVVARCCQGWPRAVEAVARWWRLPRPLALGRAVVRGQWGRGHTRGRGPAVIQTDLLDIGLEQRS